MVLILEQLKKISTFALLLLILFIVNIIFNINFKWSGISLIVRVYIFIFSFLIIYNFSLIDIEEKKKEYRELHGRKGLYYLFIASRVAPFFIIYGITVIFTLIDYIGTPEWFLNSIIALLNGKYANTVIYSLLLLIILKIRRGPSITIPLFLASSVFYLAILDKMIYNYFHEGIAVSVIKIIKYMIFMFFVISDFYDDRKKMKISFFYGAVSGVAIHTMVTFILYLFYAFSSEGSLAKMKSTRLLLRTGLSFPFSTLVDAAKNEKTSQSVADTINFSDYYRLPIEMSNEEWVGVLENVDLSTMERVSDYLIKTNRMLPYESLMEYAEKKATSNEQELIYSETFIKYMASYLPGHFDDFLSRIKTGRRVMMLWGINVFNEARCMESVPFLIDCLTNINSEVSVSAYKSLVKITGIDPAQKEDFHPNTTDVVLKFRLFYQDYRRGQL